MDPINFIKTYCSEGGSLQSCLQGAYNMGIALSIATAFLFVVFGAIQYMSGAAINTKDAGKKKIIGAITGLIIIFVSGVVLYWINPNIFSAELIVYRVTNLEPPVFEIVEQALEDIGISRGGSIAEKALYLTTIPDNSYRYVQQKFAHSPAKACNYFVYTALIASRIPEEAIPSICVANDFDIEFARKPHYWKIIEFSKLTNSNQLKSGDILQDKNKAGIGHVLIVTSINGNKVNVAEGSLNRVSKRTATYSFDYFKKKPYDNVIRYIGTISISSNDWRK